MYRTDGNRVRGNDAMYELVPHIMPKRYDASNSIKVEIDLDPIQEYIRRCRKRGVSMSHMSVIIAGYLRAASQNPVSESILYERKDLRPQSFLRIFRNADAGQGERYGHQAVF